MACFRSRWLAAGFFVCVAVLGACKKDDGKDASGKGGGGAASSQDLEVIPVESDLVMGIDFAQARQSKVWSETALPALTRSERFQKVTELLKTKCNIDPLAAVSKGTLGVKMQGRSGEAVIVLHGIQKDKALPCLDQVKDELAARQVEVARDGETVELKSPRGGLAFTFAGADTVVIVSGDGDNKARLAEVAKGKSQLKASKEFSDMYSRVQTGQTLWFLVRGDAEGLAKMLDKLNVKAKAIYGSLNVTDGLSFDGKIRTETEEQAKNLADLIKSQAEVASAMAEKVDIGNDKNDVKLQVALTAQQLKAVLPFVMRGMR